MNKLLGLSLFLVSVVFSNLFCSNNKGAIPIAVNTIDSSYKVYRIDSVSNFYLVYASRDSIRHKIVSSKQSCEKGDRIEIGNNYTFRLRSMLYDFDGVKVVPGGLVGCIYVDGATKICIEDSITDLESAENLIGLCLERKE